MLILIAQKKRTDALNTTQKIPAICNVPFLNKSRKTAKNAHFFQKCNFFKGFSSFIEERYIAESLSLLRCIQCIRSLLLSFKKQFLYHLKKNYHKGGPL